MPAHVVLAHELIHGLHYATGDIPDDEYGMSIFTNSSGFVGADIHIMEVKIDNQIYASYALSNQEDPIQSLNALMSKHYFENVETLRLKSTGKSRTMMSP